MNQRDDDPVEALAAAAAGEDEPDRESDVEESMAEAHSPAAPATESEDAAGDAAMVDASMEEAAPVAAAASARSSARRTGRARAGSGRRQTGPTQVGRIMVKVCLVLGMLLLIPGLWAVGILVGLPVPLAGRNHADKVAYLMLLCWPIAGLLVGGAIYFAKQHARHDAKVKG